jgi:Class III cytochrome C family/Outer membrane cytochrome MtrC/MtrF-like, domains II/IV
MHGISKKAAMILMCMSFTALPGVMNSIYAGTIAETSRGEMRDLPIFIARQGASEELERPPAVFDHDLHTAALGQKGTEGCAACHVLNEVSPLLLNQDVKVFKFPKGTYDLTDRRAIMYASHNACVGCHQKMTAEGKKSGPAIGLCGKCHVRKPTFRKVVWAWNPTFNYARHAKHVLKLEKSDLKDGLNVAGKVAVMGETSGKKCEMCHHVYDKKLKKLIYKKDCENSCRACHKAKDEKNARSMKHVAHSACIGCHMKMEEQVKKELVGQGRKQLTEKDKQRFGPLECKGCHGQHKELTPEEISKIPRLVRGQKDVMDLTLVEVQTPQAGNVIAAHVTGADKPRMKVVPFNHKAHEPRAQFCNTCHHHSLEKCVNCHTPQGDPNKGGGVSYERAFHKAGTKQACVGCHGTAKQDKKCAGCHNTMPDPLPKSSCPVCHQGPSGGKPKQIAALPLFHDKKKVPDMLHIKNLEKEFKAAQFPHLKIVNKLVTISNNSSLARTFHGTKEQTLCAGCHHKTELQSAAIKMPACITCHNRPFESSSLGKPGILGAYHRQCIGCHQAMHQKPKALECVKCHAAKKGLRTAHIISSINGKK